MSILKVGILGTGAIGKEHAARLQNKIAGARVTAVYDIYEESAAQTAALHNCRAEHTMRAVISAKDVDALVVASSDDAHAESVLQCIEAGKPVFCEKPLATTQQDCKKIVEAEIRFGRKLVQVGFQRRYDKGYIQLKQFIESGEGGAPLMVHCAHRNASVAPNYNTSYAVYSTAIHEIDALHWLLDDEYVSAQVIFPGSTRHTQAGFLRDPQMMMIRTKKGVLIDIEVFVNCRYGYDIQCEICCEDAVIRLPEPSFPTIRKSGVRGTQLETDWKERFIEAYDIEMQDWVNSTLQNKVNGPNAWDGYVAAVTADALVKSQQTGAEEPIAVGVTPAFYAGGGDNTNAR